MAQATRGRPPKKRVEPDDSGEEGVETPETVAATAEKSLREIAMGVLSRKASIVATGRLLTEEMLQKQIDSDKAFVDAYDKLQMTTAERQWEAFELIHSPHLLKPVHVLGLPNRFINGAVNREFPYCSTKCLPNIKHEDTYWRKHVLAGDLMGLSRKKILVMNASLRSIMKNVEDTLLDHGIVLAGKYPEKWVAFEERRTWH